MLVFCFLFLKDLKTSLLTVLPCLYTPHFLIGLRPRAVGKLGASWAGGKKLIDAFGMAVCLVSSLLPFGVRRPYIYKKYPCETHFHCLVKPAFRRLAFPC
jgi:hypothetical protein